MGIEYYIEFLKGPGIPLRDMGITGGEEGYLSPLLVADDNNSYQCRAILAPRTPRSSCIHTYLNLLPHVDLWPT
jgi:hypothetical protein